MKFMFQEFDNIIVSFSGGKDSTVILHLALEVRHELGITKPLDVIFIDQEAELKATIDYCRYIKGLNGVNFRWFQMPFSLFDATSSSDRFIKCWDDDKTIREYEDGSIRENVYGEDRFKELFSAIVKKDYSGKTAMIAGVRCDESPNRRIGLTIRQTYKWITWGKRLNTEATKVTLYPIYDWYFTDIWKYIYDNNIKYNTHYDDMFRLGARKDEMRVSSLIHETSVRGLYFLQESDPDTWNDLCERFPAVGQVKHLSKNDLFSIKDKPECFSSWIDYFYHLLYNMCGKEDIPLFEKKLFHTIQTFGIDLSEIIAKEMIKCIMTNDIEFTKIDNKKTALSS